MYSGHWAIESSCASGGRLDGDAGAGRRRRPNRRPPQAARNAARPTPDAASPGRRSSSRRVSRRADDPGARMARSLPIVDWTWPLSRGRLGILLLTERLVKIAPCAIVAAHEPDPSPSSAVQVRPVSFDPAATLDVRGRRADARAAEFPDADLYLFPELYLTGEHPFTLTAAPIRRRRRRADPRTAHATGSARSRQARRPVDRRGLDLRAGRATTSTTPRSCSPPRATRRALPQALPVAARSRPARGRRPSRRRSSTIPGVGKGRPDDLLRRLVPGGGRGPRAAGAEVIAAPDPHQRRPTARRSSSWRERTRS